VFPGPNAGPWGYLNGLYSAPDTLQHGEGYWLLYPSDGATTIAGIAPLVSMSRSIDLPAEGCWVLIGTPSVSLPASHLTVSGQAALMPGMLYRYSGSGYIPAASLEPWEGYWVFLNPVGGGGPATVSAR
jgi:hypothetical protein